MARSMETHPATHLLKMARTRDKFSEYIGFVAASDTRVGAEP